LKKTVKFGFSILLIFGFLLSYGNMTYAESNEYKSDVGVGFYGNYEYPQEPQEPNNSEEIVLDTTESGINDNDTGKLFPKTGELINSGLSLIGLLLVFIFLLLYLYKRREKQRNNE